MLHRLAKPQEQSKGDRWIYRMVVSGLGLTALFVIVGVFTLKALDASVTIPDALVAIGSGAVAALAACWRPHRLRASSGRD